MDKTTGKKIGAVMVAVLFALTGTAQSFSAMWKKVEQAQKKDLPKTQINVLSDIETKALMQHSYGNLLKAQLMTAQLNASIAPDSLMPQLKRIAANAKAAEKTDIVLAAVYDAVIGKTIQGNEELKVKNEESAGSEESESGLVLDADYWFAKALKNPGALAAAYASTYDPLVIIGKEDKTFLGDMLQVIGWAAQDFAAMHKYYDAHGNRAAACICALEQLKKLRDASNDGNAYKAKKSKYLEQVDSLMTIYSDLPEAGELAIEHYNCISQAEDVKPEEQINYINYALSHWGGWPRMNILRNAKSCLTMPSFHAAVGSEVQMPDRKREVTIASALNIGELTMSVYRLNDDITSKDEDLESMVSDPTTFDKKIRKQLDKEPTYQQTKRYIGLPAYKQIRDTMEIAPLKKGLYVVEFVTDNNLIKPERALLRVSNLMLMRQETPGGIMRMVVVSADSGEPVANAKIALKFYRNSDLKSKGDKAADAMKTLQCDEKGECVYNHSGGEPTGVKAYTEDDKYCPWSSFYGNYSFYSTKLTLHNCFVYSDRIIYRPGQTVHVALTAFRTVNHKTSYTESFKNFTLTLRAANNKVVGKKTVRTDEYGMASADFALPTTGLTGNFWLRADAEDSHGYLSFSVEEYKRPTFNIEFDKIKRRYADGDTLKVRGVAKTFAGVPVQNGKVVYSVTRRPSIFWWWRNDRNGEAKMASDTTMTNDKGEFFVPVDLLMPEGENTKTARYYSFDISAEVTNGAGESHEAETSIPLSNRPTVFTVTMPDRIERGSKAKITFNYKNIAGENIDGDVKYKVRGESLEVRVENTAKTNTAIDFDTNKLESGEYTLYAEMGSDTLSHKVVVFSLDDTKPVVKTKDWYYQKGEEFALDGKPVYIQVGSSEKQHIVYSIFTGKTMLEAGTIDLNNEVKTRKFEYEEKYGEGILVTYAWVKDGVMYKHTARLERGMPSKDLTVTWKTFRDRLTPGQKEQWTLNVKTPEGKPAKAQLLSVLYDKSLDEIRDRSDWKMKPHLYMSVPNTIWMTSEYGELTLYGEMRYTALPERDLELSHFDESLFSTDNIFNDQVRVRGFGGTRSRKFPMMGAMMAKAAPTSNMVLQENVVMGSDGSGSVGKTDESSNNDASTADNQSVKKPEEVKARENLNETAFFYPALMTDGNGDVNIKFTLPESVTTWRFMSVAHDSLMNTGSLSGEAIAKKTVMIQPNMPRFMRSGDKATISAMLSNTSENNASGEAKIIITDVETEKTIYTQSSKFALEAGKTSAVTFNVDASKLPALSIVKFIAQGNGFSDGEQHYLPVLPDKERVTNTLPFTIDKKGTTTFDISKLFPVKDDDDKLTVEYTGNPQWLMIQALPTISETLNDNAISLASAYYANSIGRFIMNTQPNIKQVIEQWKQETGSETSLQSQLEKNQDLKDIVLDETPWLRDAEKETEQKQMLINFFDESAMDYRLTTQLSKLRKLQKSDGGFTWWPGMPSSPYITNSVTEMLVRLNAMTGSKQDYGSMITNAFSFMDNVMSDEVKDMKKAEKDGKAKDMHPSELATQYLYVCAVNGRKLTGKAASDQQYLINKLKDHSKEMTIYGKATAAVILAKHQLAGADGKQMAKDYIQSIKEYTVYKDEMGRYFDTWKAYYSWCDYRIPSQVAAIEALQSVSPDDAKTVEEMQRWLLQEKRTTAWSTPINSVNAVYAFMNGGKRTLAEATGKQVKISVNGKEMNMPQATAGLGYVKAARTGANFNTLTIDKYNDGTSWGAAYGQSFQKVTEVANASSGISISRELLKNGKPATELHVGDRVTVKITISADRDYDFVQVADKRAACMEPLNQLSGYHWGFYCAPKDNATYYYFDCLAKGKRVIETDYYIDRSGSYDTGTCTAQCAYSPEYSARTAAKNIEVK